MGIMELARRVIRSTLMRTCKPGTFYRIPLGPNRGKYLGYDGSLNLDMMAGLHEPNTFEVFRQLVRPGAVVVDLGANRGYFTVYLNELVGPEGIVFAFEPLPSSFLALERAVLRNGCHQVKLVRKAAADREGITKFFPSHTHYMASLDPGWAGKAGGEIEVEAIRLDTFFKSEARLPDFIKMDIEGGGVYALPGMYDILRTCKPSLLLESHTPEEDKAIGQALALTDYAVFRSGSEIPVLDISADYRNPFGIWGTMVAVPKERMKLLPAFDPIKFQRARFGERKPLHTKIPA